MNDANNGLVEGNASPTVNISFAPYIGAFDVGKPGGTDIFERRRLIRKINKAHTKTSLLTFLDKWAVRTGWAGKVPNKPLKKLPKPARNASASPIPPRQQASPPRQPAGSMIEVVAQYAEASETLQPQMIKPKYIQVDEVGQGFFEAGQNVWMPGRTNSEGARVAEFTNIKRWKRGLPVGGIQASIAKTELGGWLEKAYPDPPSVETLDSEGRLAILKKSQMSRIKGRLQGSGGRNRVSNMQMEWIDADLPPKDSKLKNSSLKKDVRIHPIFAKAAEAAKSANDDAVRRAVLLIKKKKDLKFRKVITVVQKKALHQKLLNVETAKLLMHAVAFIKKKDKKKREHQVAVHEWSWMIKRDPRSVARPSRIMRNKPLPLMNSQGTPNYTYDELESWSKHNNLHLGKRLLPIREKYYHKMMLALNEEAKASPFPRGFKLMTTEEDHKALVTRLDLERKYALASAHANSLSIEPNGKSIRDQRLAEALKMYRDLQKLPRPTFYGRAPRGETKRGSAYYPRWYLVNIHHFVANLKDKHGSMGHAISRVDEILRPIGLQEMNEKMKMLYNANIAKFAQPVVIETKAKKGGSTTQKRPSRWELYQMQKTQAPPNSSTALSVDPYNYPDPSYYVIGSNNAPIVVHTERQPLNHSDLRRDAENIDVTEEAKHEMNNPPLHFRYGVHEPISNVGAHTESAIYRHKQELKRLTDELRNAVNETDIGLLQNSVKDLRKEIIKLETQGLTGRALLLPYVTQLTKLRIRDIDSENTTSKEMRVGKSVNSGYKNFSVTHKITRKLIEIDDVTRAYERNYFVEIPNNYTGRPLEMNAATRKYAYDNKIDLSSFRTRRLLNNPTTPIALKDLKDWITRRSYTPKELAAHSIAVDARYFRSLNHADENKLSERITAFKTNLLDDVTLTTEKKTELIAKMEEAAEALQDRIRELNVIAAPLFIQPWDF